MWLSNQQIMWQQRDTQNHAATDFSQISHQIWSYWLWHECHCGAIIFIYIKVIQNGGKTSSSAGTWLVDKRNLSYPLYKTAKSRKAPQGWVRLMGYKSRVRQKHLRPPYRTGEKRLNDMFAVLWEYKWFTKALDVYPHDLIALLVHVWLIG